MGVLKLMVKMMLRGLAKSFSGQRDVGKLAAGMY